MDIFKANNYEELVNFDNLIDTSAIINSEKKLSEKKIAKNDDKKTLVENEAAKDDDKKILAENDKNDDEKTLVENDKNDDEKTLAENDKNDDEKTLAENAKNDDEKTLAENAKNVDEKTLVEEQDKENGLTEKCALITIEPQPDGNIKTLNAQVHEATPAARAVAELESTQKNVFSKEKVAQLVDAISMEGERAFQSVGTLSNILNRAGKKLEQNTNIIVEEPGEKTVYFTNGEIMKVNTHINDLGDMKFLLEAKNPEELKGTLDKIEARDNRDKPMEMMIQEGGKETQERGSEGMDIGG